MSAGKSLICPCNHANLYYPSCPTALGTHLCMFSSYLIAHIMSDRSCLKLTVFFVTVSREYPSASFRFPKTGLIARKVDADVQVPQRINPNDFGDLETFHLAPPPPPTEGEQIQFPQLSTDYLKITGLDRPQHF